MSDMKTPGFVDNQSYEGRFALFTSHPKSTMRSLQHTKYLHNEMFNKLCNVALGRSLASAEPFITDVQRADPSTFDDFQGCSLLIAALKKVEGRKPPPGLEITKIGSCDFFILEGNGANMEQPRTTLLKFRRLSTPFSAQNGASTKSSNSQEIRFEIRSTTHIIYGSKLFWDYTKLTNVLEVMRSEPKTPENVRIMLHRACVAFVKDKGRTAHISGSPEEYCQEDTIPLLPSDMSFGIFKVSISRDSDGKIGDFENNFEEIPTKNGSGVGGEGVRPPSPHHAQRHYWKDEDGRAAASGRGQQDPWSRAIYAGRSEQRTQGRVPHVLRREGSPGSQRNDSRSPRKDIAVEGSAGMWMRRLGGGDGRSATRDLPMEGREQGSPTIKRKSSRWSRGSSPLRKKAPPPETVPRVTDIWTQLSSSEDQELLTPARPPSHRPTTSSALIPTHSRPPPSTAVAPSLQSNEASMRYPGRESTSKGPPVICLQ